MLSIALDEVWVRDSGKKNKTTSGTIKYLDGRIWWTIPWVKIDRLNEIATLDRYLVSSARKSDLSDLSSDQGI